MPKTGRHSAGWVKVKSKLCAMIESDNHHANILNTEDRGHRDVETVNKEESDV